VFDPKDKRHRQWFADFQRKSTWGHCPVRFVVADDHGDLITMIQRRLIEYYVDREFKIVEAEIKTKRSRQKIKTAV